MHEDRATKVLLLHHQRVPTAVDHRPLFLHINDHCGILRVLRVETSTRFQEISCRVGTATSV